MWVVTSSKVPVLNHPATHRNCTTPDRIFSPKSNSMRVMSQPSPVASGQLMRISRTLSSPSDTRLRRVETLNSGSRAWALTPGLGPGHSGNHGTEPLGLVQAEPC